MNTLKLLTKIHDAIGNTYPNIDAVPDRLSKLLPEIRSEILKLEKERRERILKAAAKYLSERGNPFNKYTK